MLALEEASSRITDRYEVKGYTRDQIAYHLGLIVRAGYAEGPGPRYSSTGSDPTIPSVVILDRLTPAGHDFIAAIKDDTVWARVKERLGKVGGSASLEIIGQVRSEEHTSELQSLMRISYAVFCLTKKKQTNKA